MSIFSLILLAFVLIISKAYRDKVTEAAQKTHEANYLVAQLRYLRSCDTEEDIDDRDRWWWEHVGDVLKQHEGMGK